MWALPFEDYTMTINVQKTLETSAQRSSVIVKRGMGPMAWLFVIFVLCKVFSVAPIAGWSWWLVFLPLYGPLLLVMALWLAVAVICGIVFLLVLSGVTVVEWWSRRQDRKRRKGKKIRVYYH